MVVLIFLAATMFSCAIGALSLTRYGKMVTSGVTGIFTGAVLIIWGRFYTNDNPLDVTDTDIMYAGIAVAALGALVAFYLSRFVALESRPKEPHVRREDVGYWPHSY